jgi:integrase
MTFKESLFKDYADMLELKEATGYSRISYAHYIPDFLVFCGTVYSGAECITKKMLDGWLQEKSFKTNGTHNAAISRIRVFARYQAAIGKTTYIPSGDYSVKVIKFAPYIFTDIELGKLFEAFDTVSPNLWSPERENIIPVLFRMMYCCGLRPGEPLRLLCSDIDLKNGILYIRQSKREKDRRIIMSDDLTALCRKYDDKKHPRTYFFERTDGDRLTIKWVDRQFNICWRNSGLERRANPRPYDLRHNFATRVLMHWVNEGQDVMGLIPYLSAYMGHVNFTATLYYIHLLPERLVRAGGIDWERFTGVYPEVADEED